MSDQHETKDGGEAEAILIVIRVGSGHLHFSFPAPIGMRKVFLSHTPEINYEIRSAPRRIWFDLRKSRAVSVDSVCPLEIVLTKREPPSK